MEYPRSRFPCLKKEAVYEPQLRLRCRCLERGLLAGARYQTVLLRGVPFELEYYWSLKALWRCCDHSL